MWYPQILNMMSKYLEVVPSNEVTMCGAILYKDETNETTLLETEVGN